VNRISIIACLVLGLVAAACSSEGTSQPPPSEPVAATDTPASPPAEQSEPPASVPAASDGSGSSDSALLDLIPDTIGGMSRTDTDFASNPIFAQALAGSGVDVGDVEYIISVWGSANEVTLSSMRIPGLEQGALEQLSRMMSGAQAAGGEVETTNVGGKTVLQITGEGAPAAAYMYFAEGAMFTVVSESQELSEEVLSALP
jgi:hypothetical protein